MVPARRTHKLLSRDRHRRDERSKLGTFTFLVVDFYQCAKCTTCFAHAFVANTCAKCRVDLFACFPLDVGSSASPLGQGNDQLAAVTRVDIAREIAAHHKRIDQLPGALFADSKFLDELPKRNIIAKRKASNDIKPVGRNVVVTGCLKRCAHGLPVSCSRMAQEGRDGHRLVPGTFFHVRLQRTLVNLLDYQLFLLVVHGNGEACPVLPSKLRAPTSAGPKSLAESPSLGERVRCSGLPAPARAFFHGPLSQALEMS